MIKLIKLNTKRAQILLIQYACRNIDNVFRNISIRIYSILTKIGKIKGFSNKIVRGLGLLENAIKYEYYLQSRREDIKVIWTDIELY